MLLTLISSESGRFSLDLLVVAQPLRLRQSDNAVKTEGRIVQCVGVTH